MRIPWLPPLDRTSGMSAAQQIHQHLRVAIYDGTIAPGGALPTQRRLSDHYGVSRETVRRGLDLLTRDELIDSMQGVGMFARIQSKGTQLCARCGDIIDKRQDS